ncbi:MAG: formylglycine-generating enzyme family protein [Bacteroidota bacterium]
MRRHRVVIAAVGLALGLAGCASLRSTVPDGLLPLDLVDIPAGRFLMGDFFDQQNDDALPRHERQVAAFRLMRHEVTYAEYDAYAVAFGYPLPPDDNRGRGNRAVTYVDWEEAQAFCAAYGYRLPTEVEWEYAARSGGRPERFAGTDDPDSLGAYARYLGNSSLAQSFPSGTKRPSHWGLYDLSGNVAEWIGAYYAFYPDSGAAPVYNDLEQSAMRVIRGGHFNNPAHVLHTYWRVATINSNRSVTIGFRCAADPPRRWWRWW